MEDLLRTRLCLPANGSSPELVLGSALAALRDDAIAAASLTVFSPEPDRNVLPHARPAALEAAGRDSFFLLLTLVFFFLPSVLRNVVSIGFRLSGLEPRDLVFSDEFEFIRTAGVPDDVGPEGGSSS